jgi:hypothetical protein
MRKSARGVVVPTEACVPHALSVATTLKPSTAFLLNMMLD